MAQSFCPLSHNSIFCKSNQLNRFSLFRKGACFIKKVIFLSIFIVAVCQKEIKTTGEDFFQEPWQAVGFL